MFARRRPLLRAAVVGGGAYMAGKARQRRQTEQYEADAYQDQRISNLEASQGQGGYQQAPAGYQQQDTPAPTPAGPSMSDQLAQLNDLHQQGALSDDEFAAAKSKLLGI